MPYPISLHLSPDSFTAAVNTHTWLAAPATWLEVCTPKAVLYPAWQLDEDGALVAAIGDLRLQVTVSDDTGAVAPLTRLTFTLTNVGSAPAPVNLKWTLPLAEPTVTPRWMIPALLYKETPQQWPGTPAIVGTPDLHKAISPWWTFRADLTAVPMVMAWTPNGSVALVMEEQVAGHLTAIGLDHRPGRYALVAAWPYREEPRRRETSHRDGDPTQPVISFATLHPGETVEIPCWLYAGETDPHAFAPLLRETFARWDARHPLHPWFPTADGADHTAYGLFTWHYDPEVRALWEICAYDGYYGKNARQVERFEMHPAFVSGIPYAHAMRRYGMMHDRPDIADAGKAVIDFCCENLTPWGSFWGMYVKDKGWGAGWHSPEVFVADPSAPSQEIHPRTLGDATLFAARAALAETDQSSRDLWTRAVRNNLDYLLSVMGPDGNPGEAYSSLDGRVLENDGHAGLPWITACVEGFRLTGEATYLHAALQIAAFFQPSVADAYLTNAPEGMHWLPTSEDPMNAVMAYVTLWEETRDARWLETARQAADYFMTFRWQYNTVFPAMTQLERYDLRTKGYDISSPNNVHLHPFGPLALPEMVKLWEATGDQYLLKQTRNNLLACHQMIASADGVFDARRGMMTERWHQTPNGVPKGGTITASHSWCLGCVLYADLFVEEYGHLLLNGDTGELVALEAVDVQHTIGGWQVHNPWPRPLDLRIAVRAAQGTLTVDHAVHAGTEDVLRVPVHIGPGATVTLDWKRA